MEFYWLQQFSHIKNGSQMNRLNYFRIKFRFRPYIRSFKNDVHPIVESASAVCIIPRSQFPLCSPHSEVMKTELRGVHHTEDQSLRGASHRGISLCGVHHTAESVFAVFTSQRSLFLTLIGTKLSVLNRMFLNGNSSL